MQPPYGLAVAISDRQDGSLEQQEVSGRDVVASAKIIAVQRKRWIRRRWAGRRRVAGDDETPTAETEEQEFDHRRADGGGADFGASEGGGPTDTDWRAMTGGQMNITPRRQNFF